MGQQFRENWKKLRGITQPSIDDDKDFITRKDFFDSFVGVNGVDIITGGSTVIIDTAGAAASGGGFFSPDATLPGAAIGNGTPTPTSAASFSLVHGPSVALSGGLFGFGLGSDIEGGTNSFLFGSNIVASGDGHFISGRNNTIGLSVNGSLIIGNDNLIGRSRLTAAGYNTGYFIFGSNNSITSKDGGGAYGNGETSILQVGYNNTIYGSSRQAQNIFQLGYSNQLTSQGGNQFQLGAYQINDGTANWSSFQMGFGWSGPGGVPGTHTPGYAAFAHGGGVNATESYGFAQGGWYTTSSGNSAFAQGYNVRNYTDYSFAQGQNIFLRPTNNGSIFAQGDDITVRSSENIFTQGYDIYCRTVKSAMVNGRNIRITPGSSAGIFDRILVQGRNIDIGPGNYSSLYSSIVQGLNITLDGYGMRNNIIQGASIDLSGTSNKDIHDSILQGSNISSSADDDIIESIVQGSLHNLGRIDRTFVQGRGHAVSGSYNFVQGNSHTLGIGTNTSAIFGDNNTVRRDSLAVNGTTEGIVVFGRDNYISSKYGARSVKDNQASTLQLGYKNRITGTNHLPHSILQVGHSNHIENTSTPGGYQLQLGTSWRAVNQWNTFQLGYGFGHKGGKSYSELPGYISFSHGGGCNAPGDYSFAQGGWYALASGNYSFSQGQYAINYGDSSFVQGQEVRIHINNNGCFSQGYQNTIQVSSPYSFAQGGHITVGPSAPRSFGQGRNLTVLNSDQKSWGSNRAVGNGVAQRNEVIKHASTFPATASGQLIIIPVPANTTFSISDINIGAHISDADSASLVGRNIMVTRASGAPVMSVQPVTLTKDSVETTAAFNAEVATSGNNLVLYVSEDIGNADWCGSIKYVEVQD